MKLIIITIISVLLISCNTDDFNQYKTSIKETYIPERLNITIDKEFYGNYKHHYGEVNTGDIYIDSTKIIVNTLIFKDTIDFNDPKIRLIPDCNFKLELEDYKHFRIANYIKEQNFIVLTLEDEEVKYTLGVFDKYIEVPEQM